MRPLYAKPISIVAVLVFVVLSGTSFAQAPTWAWGTSLGSSGVESLTAMVSDPVGNLYVCGRFVNTVDFDPGPGSVAIAANQVDTYILKLNAAGDLVWVKTIGGSGNQLVGNIALDPAGYLYVAGGLLPTSIDVDPGPGSFLLNSSAGADFYLLKLDTAGLFVWAQAMGGPTSSEGPTDMVVDAAGNVNLCGMFWGVDWDVDEGPGTFLLSSNGTSGDAFTMRLDSAGNFLWANSVGGDALLFDGADGLAVDDDGNVFVTGFFNDTVDFDPGPGVFNIAEAGSGDVFLTKYNNFGDLVWARAVSGPLFEKAYDIALDPDANILLTGNYNTGTDFDPNAGVVVGNTSPSDMFVLKLDSASNFQWVRTVDENSIQPTKGLRVTADAQGDVYLAGWFEGTMDADPGVGTTTLSSAGEEDVLLMKLDASGPVLWATSMSGPDIDQPSDIAFGPAGSLYVAGNYDSETLTLGGIVLNNAGGPSSTGDMFIARLDSTDLATGLIVMDPSGPEVVAYPDPFEAHVVVGGTAANDELRLFDMAGRCVLLERAQGNTTTLNTSMLNKGMYVLVVGRGNQLVRSKVVKQ